MTLKEKADEIFKKYYDDIDICEKHWDERPSLCEHHAKQCAIICVQEIIKAVDDFDNELYSHEGVRMQSHKEYYENVLLYIKNSK